MFYVSRCLCPPSCRFSTDEVVITAVRMEIDGAEAYCTSNKFPEQRSHGMSNSPITPKQSMKIEVIKELPTQRQLIEEEERKRGVVSFSVYWSYVTGIYKGALAVLAIVCQLGFLVRLTNVIHSYVTI